MQVSGLKRVLGFWEVTLAGVGVIMGAGVYALIGPAAGDAGNLLWLSMVLAAVVAGLTGLSYAELSSMLPRAGAEFDYAEKAFGRRTAFLVGWLLLVNGVVAAAAVALGFAGYLQALAGIPASVGAVLLLLVSTILLFTGVKHSADLVVLFNSVGVLGLVVVVFAALPFLGQVDYMEVGPMGFGGVMAAAALIFFAFLGFENVARLAEETKDAARTVPRALLLAIVISAVFYCAVALAAVSVLDWQVLSESNAPLAYVAAATLGQNGFLLVALIALFATSSTVVMVQLAVSRVLYEMSRDRVLPPLFAHVSKTGVPWAATIAIGLLVVAFTLIGNIGSVAGLADYTVFIAFIVVNLAVVKLRKTVPKAVRPFKVPLSVANVPVLPLVGIVSCLALFASLGRNILLGGTLVLLVGVAVELLFGKQFHLVR
ncbi:hypothetical protein AUJ65_03515 [Candidatus Micrarchaeota archaeon CG1_02_51_15]|nr:MAG: hypothetical protein AUJ65_03515 [Candidatus Micrarchaeota archaeon CG1_02_51_15]